MAIRVGWLPTGTQSAEDTRQAVQAALMQSFLNVARNGVVPGVSGSQPFALTSTGSLSCSVGPGQGWVSPAQTSAQGAYPVTIDSSSGGLPTVSFAAGGSLARTDVIYLQVQDTAEDGSGFTRGQVAVQQGANGGGVPAIPSGTLALWDVPVPAGASSISFASASFVASYTVALGGVMPSSASGVPGAAYPGLTRARTDRAMTTNPGPLEVWDGATWNPAVPLTTTPAGTPRGIMAAPVAATANGTPTPGNTVDTMDTVWSTYTFQAVAGRRYRVVLENLVCNGSIVADVYALRVRNGGASTPTTASPAVLDSCWTCALAGSTGRTTLTLEETFLASSTNTATLGFFAQRVSGTGAFTPLAPAGDNATGARKIYVEDIGNV